MSELRPFLKALIAAAATAEGESTGLGDLEEARRALSEEVSNAAAAMRVIEHEERNMAALRASDAAPIQIRLATMMARRGRRSKTWAG